MTAGAVDLIEISLSGDIYATTAGERVRFLPLLRDPYIGSLYFNWLKMQHSQDATFVRNEYDPCGQFSCPGCRCFADSSS